MILLLSNYYFEVYLNNGLNCFQSINTSRLRMNIDFLIENADYLFNNRNKEKPVLNYINDESYLEICLELPAGNLLLGIMNCVFETAKS